MHFQNSPVPIINGVSYAYTVNGAAVDIGSHSMYCPDVQWVTANSTGQVAAAAAINTTNDTATLTAHGWVLGRLVTATTTGGLPAGLATSTNYYIIPVDANTVKFASSLANAQAGTAIDLTTQGTGNHTFTPTAVSMTIKLQRSNNANKTNEAAGTSTWYDTLTSSSQAVSGTSGYMWEVVDPPYRYWRYVITVTAGQAAFTINLTEKGAS